MGKSNFEESVLITGANRGMGLGYVKYYLKKGVDVIATAKKPKKATALLQLQTKYPNQLLLLELNVANQSSIEGFKTQLKSNHVVISIAISNAGISVEEEFGSWSIANFEYHFRVNTIGPALVFQAIIPFLNQGAKLIQISSGMGSLKWNINPENGLDGYAASKCALHSITIRLAEKLKPKNIGVFAIDPGWVKTEMGGDEAPSTIAEATMDIAQTIDKLTINQTGNFLSGIGETVPW